MNSPCSSSHHHPWGPTTLTNSGHLLIILQLTQGQHSRHQFQSRHRISYSASRTNNTHHTAIMTSARRHRPGSWRYETAALSTISGTLLAVRPDVCRCRHQRRPCAMSTRLQRLHKPAITLRDPRQRLSAKSRPLMSKTQCPVCTIAFILALMGSQYTWPRMMG